MATEDSLESALEAGLPAVAPNVVQCDKRPTRDSPYCARHSRTVDDLSRGEVRSSARRYARNAGPEMARAIERLASETPDQRYTTADEVDLARMLADKALQQYADACATGDDSDRTIATGLLQSTLTHVSKMVHRAVLVRSKVKGVVDSETLEWIAMQISTIIDQEVRATDPALADRLTKRIAGITMPTDQYGGREDYKRKAQIDMVRDAVAQLELPEFTPVDAPPPQFG